MCASMGSALLKLLTLFAFLLMPLSMAGAPAAAQPLAAPAAQLLTTNAGSHCDGHEESSGAPAKAKAHCIACAALPGLSVRVPIAAYSPQPPLHVLLASWSDTPEPDTATPPPKRV